MWKTQREVLRGREVLRERKVLGGMLVGGRGELPLRITQPSARWASPAVGARRKVLGGSCKGRASRHRVRQQPSAKRTGRALAGLAGRRAARRTAACAAAW